MKSKINHKNITIDDYKTISQDEYRFFICQAKDKLVFINTKRVLGLLWVINFDSTMNVSRNPVTFNIYSQGTTKSIFYGYCNNSDIKKLQLIPDNNKTTFTISAPGLFIYEYEGDVVNYQKLIAYNEHNEVLWTSDNQN